MKVKESIANMILEHDSNYGIINAYTTATMIINEYKETGKLIYNVKHVAGQELEITLKEGAK